MNSQKRFEKMKRIAAWTGIILVAAVVLITCIVGFTTTADTKDLFMICVVCSVVIPVLIYGMLLVAKILAGRGLNQDRPDGPEDKKH